MGKVQPHEEIGPNNAGKMIIRGICFAGIANHPGALASIQAYLSARGAVSGISLAEPLTKGMSADEAQFVVNLIAKLKEREFAPEQLPKVTAKDTNKQRDEMIAIVEEELHKFVTAQKAKGKEVKITLPANTIMENVRSRNGVSYVHTLTWEDTGPRMAEVGAYVPPSYVSPKESVVKPSAQGSFKEYVPPPYVPPSYVAPKESAPKPLPQASPKISVSNPAASSREQSVPPQYEPPPYVPLKERASKPVSQPPSNEGSYEPPPYVPSSVPPANRGNASKSGLFGAHSSAAQQHKEGKKKEVEEALISDVKKGPSSGPGKGGTSSHT